MSCVAAGEAWVFCDNHQFFLTPQHWWPREYVPEGVNRLVTGAGESARISTGIATGGVYVIAEAHDREPDLDTSVWEDIGEASVEVGAQRTLNVVSADASSIEAFPNLAVAGTASLRVRVHATGRTLYYDGSQLRSGEKYLIQVWSAALADDVSLKLISGLQASGAAPAAAPPEPPRPVLPPRSPRPMTQPGRG